MRRVHTPRSAGGLPYLRVLGQAGQTVAASVDMGCATSANSKPRFPGFFLLPLPMLVRAIGLWVGVQAAVNFSFRRLGLYRAFFVVVVIVARVNYISLDDIESL